jgi:hypothetical protein
MRTKATTVAKTHLTLDGETARCGKPIRYTHLGDPRTLPTASLAELRALARSRRCTTCERLAARDIADAIESGEEAAPYVAPGPEPARYGARDLTRTGRRAIEETRHAREEAGRQWPTPYAAIRSYVHSRAEGASLRSTTDPARANRVQHSRDPSLGGREHAAVDRHRTVSLALSRAMYALEGGPVCGELALDAALLVLVGHAARVVCSSVGGETRKGTHLVWRQRLAEDAAREIGERAGVTVHAGHVDAWARHFVDAVRTALLVSGEMGARREESRERPRRVWDPGARIRARAESGATG